MRVTPLAPPDVAVFAIQECCGGSVGPFVDAEFVPLTSNEDGSFEEDDSRTPVSVVFSEQAEDLLLGRGDEFLEAGQWRFVGTGQNGATFTWNFEVDASLASGVPAVPTLGDGQPYVGSDYSEYIEGTTEVAYVGFDVHFAGPAFALEIYPVDAGERADVPLVTGTSSVQALEIGDPAPECQGTFSVPTGSTYDVRAAAYAENGERGEWSAFTRVDVPVPPSGGCSFSPRPGTKAAGWFVLALGVLAWTRRRRVGPLGA